MLLDLGWQTYALLGAGLLFVVLEVLFPSGGLLGVGALLCLGLGAWSAWRHQGTSGAAMYGLGVALLAPLTAYAGLRLLPYTPMAKTAILSGPPRTAAPPAQVASPELVGRRGRTETPLRPVGIARIDGRRLDVVTRGQHLDAGEPVIVIAIEGLRVIVDSDSADPPEA